MLPINLLSLILPIAASSIASRKILPPCLPITNPNPKIEIDPEILYLIKSINELMNENKEDSKELISDNEIIKLLIEQIEKAIEKQDYKALEMLLSTLEKLVNNNIK